MILTLSPQYSYDLFSLSSTKFQATKPSAVMAIRVVTNLIKKGRPVHALSTLLLGVLTGVILVNSPEIFLAPGFTLTP